MQYTIAAPAAVAITYIIFEYAIFSLKYLLLPCPQVSPLDFFPSHIELYWCKGVYLISIGKIINLPKNNYEGKVSYYSRYSNFK